MFPYRVAVSAVVSVLINGGSVERMLNMSCHPRWGISGNHLGTGITLQDLQKTARSAVGLLRGRELQCPTFARPRLIIWPTHQRSPPARDLELSCRCQAVLVESWWRQRGCESQTMQAVLPWSSLRRTRYMTYAAARVLRRHSASGAPKSR
jgi:hypothetical protein